MFVLDFIYKPNDKVKFMKADNLNFNELLEQLDLLPIPEHKSLLEISKKHLIEKKKNIK